MLLTHPSGYQSRPQLVVCRQLPPPPRKILVGRSLANCQLFHRQKMTHRCHSNAAGCSALSVSAKPEHVCHGAEVYLGDGSSWNEHAPHKRTAQHHGDLTYVGASLHPIQSQSARPRSDLWKASASSSLGRISVSYTHQYTVSTSVFVST